MTEFKKPTSKDEASIMGLRDYIRDSLLDHPDVERLDSSYLPNASGRLVVNMRGGRMGGRTLVVDVSLADE
jgi:hypothetical protein